MIHRRKINLIFLSGIVFIFALGIISSDTIACKNGPNYWGMGFPGNVMTTDRYKNPKNPSEYIFGKSNIPGAQDYDGSHYGTHDWIADAALRTLRTEVKNPLFIGDWLWLMDSVIARNKWPVWKTNYHTSSNRHERSRGYFTFLFATQMPDMKKRSYPDIQEIYIPIENYRVKDLDRSGGKWVGQGGKDHYHFRVENITNTFYIFKPDEKPCINKIKMLGDEAIKCIGNQKIDENGNQVSAMQPEAAAGWLGAMTHYIADLLVPAHVLKSSTNEHVYLKDLYHKWFENQLGSLTKWDKSYKSHGGPESIYFSWDISKVTLVPIIPIPPDLAATFMAQKTIGEAYRIDGNHQHIPFTGDNIFEAENSGLYLNSTYNADIFWDWKKDIETNGRENSIHRYFYDKVEKLLAWSVYYSACAMQYCYNKGKEKNNKEHPNSNYFAEFPERPIPKSIPTKKDMIKNSIDDLSNLTPDTIESNRIIRNFKNFSKLLSSVALIGIQDALRKLMEIF